MATLSSIITMVGYELQMTIGSSTTPNTFEITQWLKDAQRAMLLDLPSRYCSGRSKSEMIALSSPYDSVTPTEETMMELHSSVLYKSSSTSYVPCRIVEYPSLVHIKYMSNGTSDIDYISAYNPADNKVYIHPAGSSGDTIEISYKQDIDTADTDYQLHELTIPTAVQYACFLASLQYEDMTQMAAKFHAHYNESMKGLVK